MNLTKIFAYILLFIGAAIWIHGGILSWLLWSFLPIALEGLTGMLPTLVACLILDDLQAQQKSRGVEVC